MSLQRNKNIRNRNSFLKRSKIKHFKFILTIYGWKDKYVKIKKYFYFYLDINLEFENGLLKY